MSKIVTLENAAAQRKAEQRKALAVDLSSQIAIRCDKYEADIAFPALCAVFAQQIKKRVHSTNFMDAIGQMAQEIHRMVFDPDVRQEANKVKEEVRAELDELTKNANRWIVFLQSMDEESAKETTRFVDEQIKDLEAATKRVKDSE